MKYVIILFTLIFTGPAHAGSITKSYTFSNGGTASATEMNTNFDQLFTELNSKETRITTLEGGSPASQWTLAAGLLYYNGGYIGIGTASPTSNLDIEDSGVVAMQLVSTGDMTSVTANAMNSTNWKGNYYTAQRSRAGFTAVQPGDTIYQVNAMGNDGNGAFQSSSQIQLEVQGPVSAGIVPGKIDFKTTDTSGALDSRMTIMPDGKVGIGTNPGYPLDVLGGVNASGGYTSVSDGRLKTDVQPLADSLSKILMLQGITFHWIDRAKYGDDRQIGLIAQELEKVFPELVKTNDQGFKSVNYSALVMPTIEAVKTLNGHLEQHAGELNKIKAENTALKTQVQALKNYLCAQNPAANFCSK